jgi:hypothetical protein
MPQPALAPVKSAEMSIILRRRSTSRFYGRPYWGLEDKKEGLGLSLFADEEVSKYLQEGHKGLFERDKDLYNYLSQVYYGRKTDEAKANETLQKLLSSKDANEVAKSKD